MKTFSPVLTALLLLPVAARTRRTTSTKEIELDAVSPVARAVSLLEDIKTELETEAASDKDTRDQQACWCKTTTKEKEEAISTAEDKQQKLEALRESGSTEDASLEKRIENTETAIDADTKSLSELELNRGTEETQFKTDEAQKIEDISNLKNALVVLEKTRPSSAASLLQEDSPAATSLRVVLHDISARFAIMKAADDELYHRHAPAGEGHVALLDATSRNASHSAKLLSFLGSTSNVLPVGIAARELKDVAHRASTASTASTQTFLQSEQPHLQHYSSSTGEVLGILDQMLETMEKDLAEIQQEELSNREQYQRLAALHNKHIEEGKANLDDLQERHAQLQIELRAAEKEYDQCVAQHTADKEYLQELSLTCQNMTAEWAERSSTREEEIKAIAEALAIFKEDDNREHLAKSISFLQLRSSGASDERVQRSKAADVLRRAAQQPSLDLSDLVHDWHARNDDAKTAKAAKASSGSHRNKLSALAASAEIDDFVEVKHAIDMMIKNLEQEHTEEVEFKDECQSSLNNYEDLIYEKTELVNDTADAKSHYQSQIESKEKEIDDAKAVIAQLEVDIKKASSNREKENHAFQETVSDQRKSQKILTAVMKRLEEFYSLAQTSSSASSLAQTKAPEVTPPGHFNEYSNNAGTSVVMSLIQQIIDDSANLESEAVGGEREAQTEYETFVQECTTTKAAKATEIHDAKLAVQSFKGQLQIATNKYNREMSLLEDYHAEKANKDSECGWLLTNFDTRQKTRMGEIEALKSAKAILSGSKSQ